MVNRSRQESLTAIFNKTELYRSQRLKAHASNHLSHQTGFVKLQGVYILILMIEPLVTRIWENRR